MGTGKKILHSETSDFPDPSPFVPVTTPTTFLHFPV